MILYGKAIVTPVGTLNVVCNNEYIIGLSFGHDNPDTHGLAVSDENDICLTCVKELQEYFAGVRKKFTVKAFPHGTDFERNITEALLQIKYGETVSYSGIAKLAGHPGASRAVGRALSKNPVPIIVPCHRVIMASGSIGGYGGNSEKMIGIKHKLLRLEASHSKYDGT